MPRQFVGKPPGNTEASPAAVCAFVTVEPPANPPTLGEGSRKPYDLLKFGLASLRYVKCQKRVCQVSQDTEGGGKENLVSIKKRSAVGKRDQLRRRRGKINSCLLTAVLRSDERLTPIPPCYY